MTPSPQSTHRQIRVFISSTFIDMQEERDVLIKKIFPQLRKLCEERAVTWTEVDLRWGITTEQAAEGKVLPLCLEEIHRCRPYFIGLLGERYGWVPESNSIPADLLESQPWLKQHLDHSVTELEILHGVFSEEQMHGHAYFYFRDPKYLDSVQSEKRQDFIAENAEAGVKLAKLKQKIRGARDEQVCELRENYANPEQLGDWILEDFTKLIDRLYPKDQTPDTLDQEAARHDAYARSRRLAFVGREDLLYRLNEHTAVSGNPIVLTGESGCGKSALLAEWVGRWRKDHPDDLIIQHYTGSTPDSADWQGLVRRILSELKRAFVITDEIPIQPDTLRDALNDWTLKAAGSRQVVLVLDALNQLAEDGAARQLGWLPVAFPANFRVLVSTLPGESLDAMRKRGWPEMNVPLFTRADIAPAALAYFKIFSKTPPPDIVSKLESTPAASNALYLRAVLDELRQFGNHEELQAKAADYLSAPDTKNLYERIIERWEQDFGEDLVRESLSLIWAARRGLSESELADLLGENGQPLPRAKWTPFYLAAESSLAQRSNLANFSHTYVRLAVEHRFLPTIETQTQAHLQLAGYFRTLQHLANRKIEELPWQWQQAQAWEELHSCLTDPIMFVGAYSPKDSTSFFSYWRSLSGRYDLAESYSAAWKGWEGALGADRTVLARLAIQLGYFLFEAGRFSEAEPLLRRALAIDEQKYGADDPKLAADLHNLAGLFFAMNRLVEAETFMRRVLAIYERNSGANQATVATALNNIAQLLHDTNRLTEAEPLMQRALALDELNFGSAHPTVARDLNNLARLFADTNRLTEAEPLMGRALAINEVLLGPHHPEVATSLNNLGQLLHRTNRLTQAESVMRRVLAIDEENFGSDHPKVARDLNNFAGLLRDMSRLAEAEVLMRRALNINQQRFSLDHPAVAENLVNLAGFLEDNNRVKEAEPLMRQGVEIFERTLGSHHPKLATALGNLGQLLHRTNRLAEAEPLVRRALAILEQSFGLDHPRVAGHISDLAALLQATNRLAEAEPLIRRALAINERSFGPDHTSVANQLNNLFRLLHATNRLTEAEPLLRRALAIDERSLGPNHPTVARDLNNLGRLLRATRRHSEAEPLFRRALAIEESCFSQNHPNLVSILSNLAQLLHDTGRLEEAEPLMRQAAETSEKSLGADHPNTATTLNNLAQLLRDTGCLPEAEQVMRRVVEILLRFTVITRHQHPNLLAVIHNYAGLLSQMGHSGDQVLAQLNNVGRPFGIKLGG